MIGLLFSEVMWINNIFNAKMLYIIYATSLHTCLSYRHEKTDICTYMSVMWAWEDRHYNRFRVRSDANCGLLQIFVYSLWLIVWPKQWLRCIWVFSSSFFWVWVRCGAGVRSFRNWLSKIHTWHICLMANPLRCCSYSLIRRLLFT